MTKQLALFDFDGTLCTKDSFTGFMRYAFSNANFYRKCLKVSPEILAYYGKIYPAYKMRPKLYKALFKHIDLKHAEQLGEQYAQYLFSNCLSGTVLSQLYWHKRQGHQIAIVSASLDLYLKPLAKHLEVDLICSQVDHFQQRLTGQYQSRDCSNKEKAVRIRQYFNLDQFQTVYAYGNSIEDAAMLNLADHAYWIGEQHHIYPYKK